MIASADSTATFSHQLDSAYPPPSCSAFHGRSGSSECTVTTCGTPYSSAARCPPRFAYQVCECTRSVPETVAVMTRSTDMVRSAWLAPASWSHGWWATAPGRSPPSQCTVSSTRLASSRAR